MCSMASKSAMTCIGASTFFVNVNELFINFKKIYQQESLLSVTFWQVV